MGVWKKGYGNVRLDGREVSRSGEGMEAGPGSQAARKGVKCADHGV